MAQLNWETVLMSRAWMPMYWGDYLRDTRDLTTLQHGAYLLLIGHYWQHEHLPTDEKQLATIAGLSLSRWRAIQAPIAAKFSPDWRHGRIDEELEQTERKINQRIIAGRRGGERSGVARAQRRGHELKEAERKQLLHSRSSKTEATVEAGSNQPRTNHQVIITTTELGAEEESGHPIGDASPELAHLIRKRA